MKKIIIAILTLTLIVVAFASCTKTETETTTYEPVIEFPTEEITTDEVTTETSTTEEATTETSIIEESTTEMPTTKKPETTTYKEEATTKHVITEIVSVDESETGYDPTIDNPYYNVGSSYDPNRAGLIYDIHEIITSYDKLKEGDIYFAYDKNGYLEKKQVPYSNPEDDPGPMRCEYCGKEMQTFNGEHFGCYYGYCERWFFDMNCPECNEFVLANTCHTCKK